MRPPQPDEYDAALSEHAQSVWRLVVRLLGNDGHDAADCFQQAFVELASRQKRLHDVSDLGALLKRIAATRAIDVVRRRIRERARSQPANEACLAVHRAFEPDAQAEAAELLDDFRAALAQLPDLQATVFVLTQIEDMPHDEVAQATGKSVRNIRVLLHRARVSLRERLKSHTQIEELES